MRKLRWKLKLWLGMKIAALMTEKAHTEKLVGAAELALRRKKLPEKNLRQVKTFRDRHLRKQVNVERTIQVLDALAGRL